ncbi:hypothetical protein HMPREF7215_0489 [Pyramidobacter piscolens W5455]|uniref:Uncharacterized protein n=1 Tax=Pyramidobacter piscolens W5455 TaxID=352165 RepID=A0ABM9ZYL8_9BACT|nr:hypothetical protein HMPREF7215_0489 [Pyramidobacter piscolens W5455]
MNFPRRAPAFDFLIKKKYDIILNQSASLKMQCFAPRRSKKSFDLFETWDGGLFERTTEFLSILSDVFVI